VRRFRVHGWTSVTLVTFESDSKMHRIDESAFQGSDLHTIESRASVAVVCKSCFSTCRSQSPYCYQLAADQGLASAQYRQGP
jgi:hypothetical protein